MRTTNFFTTAVIAAAFLTSCIKTTVLCPPIEVRTATISIEQHGVATRGIGSQVANNTAVSLTDGLLLFTDNAGKITKRVDVNATGNDYAGNVIGKDKLFSTGGATIPDVPSASTGVCFVGNPPAGVKNKALVNAKIRELDVNVYDQYNETNAGVDNVTLYGAGTLSPDDVTGESIDYTATFDIRPIVTRIEIRAINGDASPGSKSMNYTITGVFINQYYEWMQVDGKTIGGFESYVNLGTSPKSYPVEGSSPGAVFDYDAKGMAGNDYATPYDMSNVWAYNLLAPTGGITPSIVIRLDDVTVDGSLLNGPQFVTFSTFKIGTAIVTTLPQGRVWKLGVLKFTNDDISPAPFVKGKSVSVRAQLMPWETDNSVLVEH